MWQAVGNGFMTGLVISSFMGPIFFMMLELGLAGRIRGIFYLALGTFVSDFLSVLIIYNIAKNLVQYTTFMNGMYIVGGLVLIVIGITTLLKSRTNTEHPPVDKKYLHRLFLKGFLINTTNPNVFFFWFGAVMLTMNLYNNQTVFVMTHFLTALLMVLTTDLLKGYGASLLRPFIKDNTMLYLSKLSGLIIIVFGVKLIFFH